MIALQITAGASSVRIWPRAAIHDTVAAIAKQPVYRRGSGTTLLDRLMAWIGEAFARLVRAMEGVPHGRVVATLAATAVVLLVIARIAYAARLRSPAATRRTDSRSGMTTATDPWRDAEQLAASGRYTDAAHALYRAALTELATRRLVRLHESKTSGDYARELRHRGSPSYTPFRRFGARYDRIIYGTGECGPAEYAALLEDARGLMPVAERAA